MGVIRYNMKKVNHIAISIEGNIRYAAEKKISIEEVFKNSHDNIKDVMRFQVENNIPIISLILFSKQFNEIQDSPKLLDAYDRAFQDIISDEMIAANQIKISFMGKWYNLPGKLVERIKYMIDETKDYDKFFLNFYLNYDGQEEILDAVRLLLRQVEHGKISGKNITKTDIKDNLYSSYFLPPDLIIRNGKDKSIGGILLWDSQNSTVVFTDKYWPEFSIDDLKRAIESFKNR